MPEANPENPHVFISYAREDAREVALRLRDDLTAAGHSTWLDLSDIGAGAAWEQAIEQAIESAGVFLALMSVGSYVSDICRAELSRAVRKDKPIIPVQLDADADRPLALETRNFIDLSQPDQYDGALQAIIKTINTGQIPAEPVSGGARHGPVHRRRGRNGGGAQPPKASLKRDARAFRRYLADLREEPWLGARHWWPDYLFYYADVQEIAGVLTAGVLRPQATERGTGRRSRHDRAVRLFFRPRTPELFSREGCRPEAQRHTDACPVPVYLLFDSETLLTHADTRFCEGDPAVVGRTYKAASYFRDLPFDLIYHDSWFRSDERDEIMQARRAQVIVPDALPLDYLRMVWCRSAAEAETLRSLLPPETWAQWRDLITTRSDTVLFNRKWLYVETAELLPDAVQLRFNPCDARESADCGPFDLRVAFTAGDADTPTHTLDLPAYTPDSAGLVIELPVQADSYRVRVTCDDALIYAGRYVPVDGVV